MSYPALGDAVITIPSSDLQSIVLTALGKQGIIDAPTTNPDGSMTTTGISVGGMSVTNWALIGVAAYFLFFRK
jgi:hypothetical protein